MARIRPQTHRFERPLGPGLSYGFVDGPPTEVVFIHGIGARWQVFSPLMAHVQADFTSYAFDLRGHGESDRVPDGYALADFVDDAAGFIESQTHTPVNVYGHSLGGWIALELAAQRPDLVRALIVADSAIYPEYLDPEEAISYLSDLPLALRAMARSLNQLDPEVLQHYRDGRLLGAYDPDQVLGMVQAPVTLIQADPEHGALMTDQDVLRASSQLSNSSNSRIEGVGHGLHVEDMSAVGAAVRAAFNGERRSAP